MIIVLGNHSLTAYRQTVTVQPLHVSYSDLPL
jgi:hypothetical protein